MQQTRLLRKMAARASRRASRSRNAYEQSAYVCRVPTTIVPRRSRGSHALFPLCNRCSAKQRARALIPNYSNGLILNTQLIFQGNNYCFYCWQMQRQRSLWVKRWELKTTRFEPTFLNRLLLVWVVSTLLCTRTSVMSSYIQNSNTSTVLVYEYSKKFKEINTIVQ